MTSLFSSTLPLRARFALSLLATLALLPASARAANFNVTNTGDSGAGSLRAAIDLANTSAGADTIAFNIPPNDPNFSSTTGVAMIRPTTQLPSLTDNGTTIDGTTQTTNRGNTNLSGPEIALATATTGAINAGLAINSNDNTVKNLIVSGFSNGIAITGNASTNRVEGCYIGTNHTGLAAGSVLNVKGLLVFGTGNIIGGVGVGNRIGFNQAGGVQLLGTGNDLTSNVIVSNGGAGILVTAGMGHTFSQNSIFSNSSLGISLSDNAVTPNDPNDPDTGNNNRQNLPLTTGVSESGGNTLVSGTLNSTPSSSFTIELFRNSPGAGSDPTGFGEGELFADTKNVSTDAGGNVSFSFVIPGTFAAGTTFAATATRATSGDTSEFGTALELGGALGLVTNTRDGGVGSLRNAISSANMVAGATISFNIPPSDSGFNPTTGVATIAVQSALPSLSSNGTTIDGVTQTTNRGNTNPLGPEVALVPSTANAFYSGLQTGSIDNALKGLIVSGFLTNISIINNGNRIEGCYIGTDHTGLASGQASGGDGIFISGNNNVVGGTSAEAGNRIAFHRRDGVNISEGINNDILGNRIFSNLLRGVFMSSGTGHTLVQNSIFGNGDLGIDLLSFEFGSKVTRNDVGDADTGVNNGQNLPFITNVSENGGNTLVSGTLNSTPSANFSIEVFHNTPAVGPDPTGFGEGEIFSGRVAISTDAGGNRVWSLSVPSTFALGTTFSATATATATGDTSEFGPARSLAGDASLVTNTSDSGSGSLRSAIDFANNLPDAVISFDIPPSDSGFDSATGVATIALQSQLPVLTGDGITIDGTTQTINRGNTNPLGPEISLVRSASQFFGRGLQVDSRNNTIKGLIISGFISGLRFIRSGNRVLGCYIGTDYTGLAPGSARNGTGIDVVGSGNFFGGPNSGDGNRIGFNGTGIFIGVSGDDVIGSDIIGNVIFSNGGDGVSIIAGAGNTVSQNSIFSNGSPNSFVSGQGINVGGNRQRPNDVGDGDTGANNLQNFPAITSVSESGGNTLISGTLGSTPSSPFTLELFRNSPAVGPDPTGFGEGEVFLSSTNVSSDENGNAMFSFTVPGTFAVGTTFTATATHSGTGDTSGFGRSVFGNPTVSGAIISEFRLRGATGSNDEYVELFNTTDAPLDVTGWSVTNSASTLRLTVPNGTVIPTRGHFLFTANSFTGAPYSLTNYASGDLGYLGDIPDTASLTLLNGLGTTIDTASASSPTQNGQFALVRPSTTANSEFILVSTTGDSFGSSLSAIQGAPGPQNLASPIIRNDLLNVSLFDNSVRANARPNQVRVAGAVSTSAPQGTILFRRQLSNTGSQPITRLRLRLTSVTTFGARSGGQSDLRLLSSTDEMRTSASQGGPVPVSGLTLEAPSTEGVAGGASATGGGGVNSSIVDVDVNITPLQPGEMRNFNILFGVVTPGSFNLNLDIEALVAPDVSARTQ